MLRPSRWADLPEELIITIATNLDATRDRIAAMCTCRAWRDAVAMTTHSLTFQLPPGQRITIRKAQQLNALVKLAAHHCVDVHTVTFAQWHGLDDTALIALLSHAAPRVEVSKQRKYIWSTPMLPPLQELCMPSCTMVTDAALHAPAASLRFVKRLVLSNCMQLTDASMMVLAEHAAALEQLSVCGCGALTDKGVAAVGRGCPQLRCINLGWCEAVGDAGVGALAAAMGPRLLDIDLCGCFRVCVLQVVVFCKCTRGVAAAGDRRWRCVACVALLQPGSP